MSTPSPPSTDRTSNEVKNMNNPYDQIAIKEAQLKAKITRLQAQQRRQKLIEDLEQPKRKSTGIKFPSAFLIVMAIHVAAIGGFYGVSTIRKMHSSDKLALAQKSPAYAGVPESSPETVKNALAALVKTSPLTGQGALGAGGKKGKIVAAVTTTNSANKGAKKLDPSTLQSTERTDHSSKSATSLKPSPAIRALFAKGHSATSSNDRASSSESLSEGPSNATKALTTMASEEQTQDTAPVTTPRPVPAPPTHYTVGPGDTLSKVALMMGLPASKIRDANGLDSGNSLHVGQNLTIPSAEAHPPLQLVEKEPKAESPKPEDPEIFTPKLERIAPNGVYTVQRGDNPYSVARRLGVSFTDLMVANSISNPADVTIGMKLKVPGNTLASN